MANNNSFSEIVNILRFPLSVLVVFIHSFGVRNVNIAELHLYPLKGDSIYDFIRICFSDVLPSFAVPMFFLISGYFFFIKYDKFNISIYLQQIKKRFYSLLVPYIIWNIIPILIRFIGVVILRKSVIDLFNYYNSEGWINIFWNFNKVLNAPINFPLWYIRDLIIVVLITPIIFVVIKRFKVGFVYLILLCLCYVLGMWVKIIGFSSTAILFFSIGAFLGVHNINFLDKILNIKHLLFLISFICLIIGVWYNANNTLLGGYFQRLYVLFVVPAVFCICSGIKYYYNRLNNFLGQSSFFIYVTHTILILPLTIMYIDKIIYSNFWLIKIIKYFFVPILTIIICLLLFYLTKRLFPKFMSIILGNR